MREIKFRAWHLINEEYIDGDDILGGSFPYNQIEGITTFRIEPTANIILEQYTGLKDSEDKEIYEGDIVTCTEGPMMEMGDYPGLQGPFEVGFKVGSFTIEYEDKGFWCILHFPKIKKLGNIHENPELLKEKDK